MPVSDSLSPKLLTLASELSARVGVRLMDESHFRGELTYRVAAEDWTGVLTVCKNTPQLAFDQLDSLVGDHLPERSAAPFEVTAHLVSHTKGWRLRITWKAVARLPATLFIAWRCLCSSTCGRSPATIPTIAGEAERYSASECWGIASCAIGGFFLVDFFCGTWVCFFSGIGR